VLKTNSGAVLGLNTLSNDELINLIDSASKVKFSREYALDSLALITARLKDLKQRVTNLAKDNPATPFARWVAFHRVPLRSLAQLTDEQTRRERITMLLAAAPDDGYWEQPESIYQEDALVFFNDVREIVKNNQLPAQRIKAAAAQILSLGHQDPAAKFNEATEETVKKMNRYRYPFATRLKKAYGTWKGWIGLGGIAGLTIGAWWAYSRYKPPIATWAKNSAYSAFLGAKSSYMAYTGSLKLG
jgi:hypothetical protein